MANVTTTPNGDKININGGVTIKPHAFSPGLAR